MDLATARGKLRVMKLDMPVQFVKGIGPRRSEDLAALGIVTIADLLEYPPFRYEDRTQYRQIRSLREDEWALVHGTVCDVRGFDARRRNFSVVEVLVRDETGSVRIKFFNQPYLRNVYRQGVSLIVYGQVRRDLYSRGAITFINPECEIAEDETGGSVHSGRVVPVYRKIGGLRPRVLRQAMHFIISNIPPDLNDPLPAYLRKQLRLPSRIKALEQIHFPEIRSEVPAEREKEMETLNSGLSPAHKRLIFDELFEMQVAICVAREGRVRLTKNRPIILGEGVRRAIKRILPFHPTEAQKRVLKEIADDLRSP